MAFSVFHVALGRRVVSLARSTTTPAYGLRGISFLSRSSTQHTAQKPASSSSSSSSSSSPPSSSSSSSSSWSSSATNDEQVINRFEQSRTPLNEANIKKYLASLVAAGKINELNVPRFVASLRGWTGGSPSPPPPPPPPSSLSSSSYFPPRFSESNEPVRVVVTSMPPEEWPWRRFIFYGVALFIVLSSGIGVYGSMSPIKPGGGIGSFMPKTHSRAERVTTKFSDVKGCDEAIEELREVVEYLREPSTFVSLGAQMPRGVLLSGPPGTGKTLLARAVAGEAGVPFLLTTGSSFDEMFVGVGSRRVRDLFAEAKQMQPCIIFIDEIDAIGQRRTSNLHSSSIRDSLNTLLTEMDGFLPNKGIVVIAATNMPETLDPALKRPGRFDKNVTVHPPDMNGRLEILELYTKSKPLSSDVSLAKLARGTPGFTGADLANLINLAAIKASRLKLKEIPQALFEDAKDDLIMGVKRASAAARISEEDRKMTAYHEGGHALVAFLTPGANPVHKATVMPRGHSLGATHSLPEKDQHSVSRQQLLAQIATALAGRAAEDLIYGSEKVSTGASGDFQAATQLARNMIGRWGMSEAVGYVYHDDPSKDKVVSTEVKQLLDTQYKYALDLLKQNESALHRIAQALSDREELSGKEIGLLIEGRPLPPLVLKGEKKNEH